MHVVIHGVKQRSEAIKDAVKGKYIKFHNEITRKLNKGKSEIYLLISEVSRTEFKPLHLHAKYTGLNVSTLSALSNTKKVL